MNIVDGQKLIQKKMNELPPSLRGAIDSSGWERKIFDIGKRNKLHIDDLAYLQFELALAIVGLSSQADFSFHVKDKLGIDDETMDKIVEDINDEIFSHIRDHIKEDVFKGEKEKYSESGLSDSEEKEMKKAGISFKDEEEIETPAPEEESVDQGAKEEGAPNKLNVNVTKTPVPTAPPEPAASTSASLQSAGVFKTKIREVDTEGKPKNFFDPYREPVE